MFEVTIRGDSGGFLTISFLGRSHPGAKDYWDANCVSAAVKLQIGGFRASVVGDLRAEELVQFLDELSRLQNTSRGTADFKTMEEWLSIRAKGDGRGHLVFHCVIRDQPGVGNTLTCALSTDQTFTQSTVHQLAEAVEAFPIIGSP